MYVCIYISSVSVVIDSVLLAEYQFLGYTIIGQRNYQRLVL